MIQTIKQLLQLQEIDSALDAIEKKKGSLPKELTKFEADIKNLQHALENVKNQIAEQKQAATDYKVAGKEAEQLVERYKKEQLEVVNNPQEYDAITKEIAMQELEMQLAKKKTRGCYANIESYNEQLSQTKLAIGEKQKSIDLKKEALAKIDSQSKSQVDALQDKRKALLPKIKNTALVDRYQKMRKDMSLVVAKVAKQACTGCFIIVPAQQQIEINRYKKVIVCESCGRILSKVVKAEEKITTPTRRKSA